MARANDKYAAIKKAEKEKGTNPFAKANENLTRTTTINTDNNSHEPVVEVIEKKSSAKTIKPEESAKIVVVEEISPENIALPKSISNLFGAPKKKRTGKSRSIYLYDDHYDMLEQIATSQGLSASKVLNEILDNIFEHKK